MIWLNVSNGNVAEVKKSGIQASAKAL